MAKTIDVLLTKPVMKLGTMGEVVSVKAGYARNYLLPQGFAILADGAAKRQIEVLQQQAKQLAQKHEAQAAVLKKELDGISLQIAAKVAHDNVLFGSVGIRDIVKALAANDVKVDPRQVHLHENFKNLGSYEVTVRLHSNVEATIKVQVVNDNPDGVGLDEALSKGQSEEG
ncbi:MAG: 50S ribosomal protein L9 [Planctomycetota bacterium]|jgi:large subunit ribosomal protein L9|nr:50S ribosomal protein L9 [Planctomycetota bacterium]